VSTRQEAASLYEAIRSLVLSARQSATRGVNLLQVYTNYEIGRRIFEQEQQGADRAQYGKEIVRDLAARLTGEFGSGSSISNLKYMRQFYVAYPGPIPAFPPTSIIDRELRVIANWPDIGTPPAKPILFRQS
jgi:hypothetical protein